MRTRAMLAVVLLTGLVAAVMLLRSASAANGGDGFPLDDAWIHLQFAHNLQATGSFSYFRDEMPTSGSTSPLFTVLLALGLFLRVEPMTVSHALGILFLLLSAAAVFRLGLLQFEGRLLFAAPAALLTVLEPRLLWASLSGMETTLFAALLLWAVVFFRAHRPVLLGTAAGLAVWARPEGILLIPILAADLLYKHSARTPEARKGKKSPRPTGTFAWIRPAWTVLLPLLTAYAGFNLLLSGSVLPNTYAAKTAYYAGGSGDFPAQVFRFLTAGHQSVLAIFAAAGAAAVLFTLLRRRPEPLLPCLLIPLALFLAYWQRLPFLYQEGRYLMPILPFILILGMHGVKMVPGVIASRFPHLRQRFLRPVPAAAFGCLFIAQYAVAAYRVGPEYASACKYIGDRQVRTALWLAENLPPDAVVGTHDIGAIGYHSGRRIADMVGLVSPGMIGSIGSFDGLRRFLVKEGVTHLAVLRNWFEIDNQRVLFRTDEAAPEVMEVLEFDPARVHFVPQNVTRILDLAAAALAQGNLNQAAGAVGGAVGADPRSSRAHLLSARVLFAVGRPQEAAREAEIAAGLRPSYREAEELLATIAAAGAGAGERRP